MDFFAPNPPSLHPSTSLDLGKKPIGTAAAAASLGVAAGGRKGKVGRRVAGLLPGGRGSGPAAQLFPINGSNKAAASPLFPINGSNGARSASSSSMAVYPASNHPLSVTPPATVVVPSRELRRLLDFRSKMCAISSFRHSDPRWDAK